MNGKGLRPCLWLQRVRVAATWGLGSPKPQPPSSPQILTGRVTRGLSSMLYNPYKPEEIIQVVSSVKLLAWPFEGSSCRKQTDPTMVSFNVGGQVFTISIKALCGFGIRVNPAPKQAWKSEREPTKIVLFKGGLCALPFVFGEAAAMFSPHAKQ